MITLFLLAAAATNPDITACNEAVHGNLAAAATICDAGNPKIDLFAANQPSEYCIAAMRAGMEAGKYGPHLPAAARAGLIREFDTKASLCANPPKPKAIPEDHSVKLWD